MNKNLAIRLVLVLLVAAAGVGVTLYLKRRQRTRASEALAARLTAEDKASRLVTVSALS